MLTLDIHLSVRKIELKIQNLDTLEKRYLLCFLVLFGLLLDYFLKKDRAILFLKNVVKVHKLYVYVLFHFHVI